MVQDTQRDDAEPDKRSQRIRQVVEDCLRRRAEGESLSDESIIEAHPDLLPGLAEELRKLRLITAAWQKAEQGPSVDMDPGTDRRRGLEVRCPHCQTPVEMVADTPFTDITCSCCGSSFSLAGDETITRHAASITTVGHFELVERLGIGGFGTVWKARDTELDRTVTLKIPRAGQLDRVETEQFLREARTAAQLKHPNIVSVHEVGRDGETVYIVSDLVRGLSLADWLTGQRPTASEAAELCATIAGALHHAHQAGVVHRDLKPANIMIDAEGQPHIMDFGLAKRDAGELTLTTDGQVLGTPAYMPPEQAEGKAHQVDGRSDVYSLGVILFELLTGELPFRGNARMLIHQVINDEPPAPRKLNATVPRDLETICLKCLEKEPTGRYSSAKDLADELRRFLRGEPIHARPIGPAARVYRWCKRKPLVAGLAATAALLLVAVAVVATVGFVRTSMALEQVREREDDLQKALDRESEERKSARKAQEEALRNSQMAREAVDKFFTQVSEDPKLKAHGLEKLRSSLLETARKFYEEFVKQKPDDPKLRAELLGAYLGLGNIDRKTGRLTEAEAAYEAAQKIAKRLVAEHRNSQEDPDELHISQGNLAVSYNDLGALYAMRGLHGRAKEAYQAAQEITKRLLAEHPNSPQYQLIEATTYHNLGWLYRLERRRAEAEEAHQAALKICERLVAKYPNNPKFQHDLGSCHTQLGALYGASKKAKAHFDEALRVFKRVAAKDPDVPEFQSELAGSYTNLAGFYSYTNQPKEAEAAFQEAIEIFQHLAAEHRLVLVYQQNLAICYYNLGSLYLTKTNQPKKAEATLQEAIKAFNGLRAVNPDVPEHQHGAGKAHVSLGLAYLATDRPKEAEAELQAALGILEPLAAKHPHSPEYRFDLALCHTNLAKLLKLLDRVDAAGEAFLQALSVLEKLVADFPKEASYQKALAENYFERGDSWANAGRYQKAEDAYGRLLELFPDSAGARNQLAWLLATCPEEQIRHPARAVELAKKAVKLAPQRGEIWNTLGVAHYRDANWKGAIEALERSLELNGDNSLDFFFLAMARWQLGGKDEGRQCYQKAIESMEKNKPNDKELRRFRAEAEELMGVTKTSPTEKEKQTESQR